jgi:L-ascorbate metabolism protein UlaG (beta-lactamase superfamily)
MALVLTTLTILLALLLGWLRRPQTWAVATGWHRIPEGLRPETRSTFTTEHGPLELFWLGHSGFILQWAGLTVLLDPIVSKRCTVAKRILEFPDDVETLLGVDAALITHAHFDHLNVATLRRLPRLRTVIVPACGERFVREAGLGGVPVQTLAADQAASVGDLEILAVPAAHHGGRFHPWRVRHPAIGYILRHGTFAVYFAGDTAFANDFEAIRDRYRPQLAILPIGAFAPRIPLKHHHMNPEEAVQAAHRLGSPAVVPCHFGTFTLSFDRPWTALPRFARTAHATGLRWFMPVLWKRKAAGR